MEGRGVVISTTDCYRETTYGEPIVALKSFILSPFIAERDVETVVAKILEARGENWESGKLLGFRTYTMRNKLRYYEPHCF